MHKKKSYLEGLSGGRTSGQCWFQLGIWDSSCSYALSGGHIYGRLQYLPVQSTSREPIDYHSPGSCCCSLEAECWAPKWWGCALHRPDSWVWTNWEALSYGTISASPLYTPPIPSTYASKPQRRETKERSSIKLTVVPWENSEWQ